MSSEAATASRRPATPYARKLARGRGLALELISGTGPNGRIVAADVEAFATRHTAEKATPKPAANAGMPNAVSVFSVMIDLVPAKLLLADLEQAGANVTIETLLVRTAALALEAVPVSHPAEGALGVVLERGSGAERHLISVADPHLGRIGSLHEKLGASSGNAPEMPTAISVRCLSAAGIRPLAMPLLPEISLRLVLTAPAGDTPVEALLVFDADRIGEDAAATLLARVRDGLEKPLRLLA